MASHSTLHPYIQKQGRSNRLWLLTLLSFLTLAFLATLIYTRDSISISISISTISTVAAAVASAVATNPPLSAAVSRALIHYASNSNNSDHMSYTDMKQIDIRRPPAMPVAVQPPRLRPHGGEPPLDSLNYHGRTVFIDENRYYTAYIDEKYREIEAYGMAYTTKLSEAAELIAAVKEQ